MNERNPALSYALSRSSSCSGDAGSLHEAPSGVTLWCPRLTSKLHNFRYSRARYTYIQCHGAALSNMRRSLLFTFSPLVVAFGSFPVPLQKLPAINTQLCGTAEQPGRVASALPRSGYPQEALKRLLQCPLPRGYPRGNHDTSMGRGRGCSGPQRAEIAGAAPHLPNCPVSMTALG